MSDRDHCVHLEGYCVAGELRQLRLNAERDQALIARLHAERERAVSSTELGKLSEELEAENWATGAALVRSVMHERERMRATVARFRALATHLVERECAPSFDGYGLAAGLDAAADLLEGRPGPIVWDSDLAKDAPLSTLRTNGGDPG